MGGVLVQIDEGSLVVETGPAQCERGGLACSLDNAGCELEGRGAISTNNDGGPIALRTRKGDLFFAGPNSPSPSKTICLAKSMGVEEEDNQSKEVESIESFDEQQDLDRREEINQCKEKGE
ncbi:hypothetical protein A2U01_0048679, partial [Trifolium medium]|nr:hypothetical protein [Trifolium medium]